MIDVLIGFGMALAGIISAWILGRLLPMDAVTQECKDEEADDDRAGTR